MKKILSLILTFTIMFTIGYSVLAHEGLSKAIYIYSHEIPEPVDDFALEVSKNLPIELYEAIEIDIKDICDLQLMSGFTPYEYDKCERQVYYFPIQGNGKIVAMLKVIDNGNNEYSAQIEKSGIEDILNKISNTSNCPIVFVMTNECLYCLDSNSNYTQVETFWASYETSNNNVEKVPNLDYKDITFKNGVVVEISARTSRSIVSSLNSPNAVSLNVPIVSNYSNTNYPAGVCWASAAASLIKHRLSTSSTANSIRDSIVAYGYSASSSQITSNMKSAMEGYLNISMTKTTTLSFSSVQSALSSNKPVWSLWTRNGGGHCLVIRHYSTASNGTKYMGFMDCNKTNYTVMVYGSSFTNGTYVYTWQTSVY